MKTETTFILNAMRIISWVVFIGLCVKASTVLIVYLTDEFSGQESASSVAKSMNSSRVLINNPRYFTATSISIIILYFLKAFMMYQVLQIFLKIDLNNPFSRKLYEIISRLSGLALTIGLTNIMLKRFALWMTKRGETHNLFSFLDSADEFIFFAGILFVLSLVFKRGIEMQTENELTI